MKKISRFTHIDDAPLIRNVDVPGADPRDEGIFKELITEETGSTDLYLGIGWLKAGEVHILHHHPKASEFYYIVDGSSEIIVDDETEQVRPGSVIYIPAGAKHKIVNNTDKTCVVLFGYNVPQHVCIWDE